MMERDTKERYAYRGRQDNDQGNHPFYNRRGQYEHKQQRDQTRYDPYARVQPSSSSKGYPSAQIPNRAAKCWACGEGHFSHDCNFIQSARSPHGGRKKGFCVLCSEPRGPNDWPTHQSSDCPALVIHFYLVSQGQIPPNRPWNGSAKSFYAEYKNYHIPAIDHMRRHLGKRNPFTKTNQGRATQNEARQPTVNPRSNWGGSQPRNHLPGQEYKDSLQGTEPRDHGQGQWGPRNYRDNQGNAIHMVEEDHLTDDEPVQGWQDNNDASEGSGNEDRG